jgi:hypothetical protein
MNSLLGRFAHGKRMPVTPAERQFYAEAARLDLSLFEVWILADRPCRHLGTLTVAKDGRLTLDTRDREISRQFRQALSSGMLEHLIGGMEENGTLWDGSEFLDSRYTPNVLLWLCGWNDFGVFSPETRRALKELLEKYKIEKVLRPEG